LETVERTKRLPRHTKFILGANFAHQATESYRHWQLLLARKENPWHESLRCWQTVFSSLANGVSGVLATEAVNWIKARVCGLQADRGRSDNFKRAKKEPAILSFSLQE
jgi:hypothetical protein